MDPHNPGGFQPQSPFAHGLVQSLLAHLGQAPVKQAQQANSSRLSGLLNALHQKMAQDALFRGAHQQPYTGPVPTGQQLSVNPGGPAMFGSSGDNFPMPAALPHEAGDIAGQTATPDGSLNLGPTAAPTHASPQQLQLLQALLAHQQRSQQSPTALGSVHFGSSQSQFRPGPGFAY